MAYKPSNKNQNWLLPLSIQDMIPEDHICFLVEEFADSLDYSSFDLKFDGAGAPAYQPRIPLKVLLQGMLSKVRSTRKLASACRENFVFMYLAEKTKPSFNTVNRFRKDNKAFLKYAFKETIKLASEHDLVDLNLICTDGSTIKANANKKRAVKKDSLDILDKAIDKMIEEDIAIGDMEEELYGDKEENLTGKDIKDIKRIVREYKQSKDKEKARKKLSKAREEIENNELEKASLTDPEARIMLNKQGFSEFAYNTQLSVDSKNQIILANDVCQDGHDANQLVPQIKNVEENVGKLPEGTKIGVDCAYSSGENIKFSEDNKLDLYVPSRAQAQEFNDKEQTLKHDKYEYDWETDEIIVDGIRLPYHHSYFRKDTGIKILVYQKKGESAKMRKQVPALFRERLRMKEKMETPEAKRIYDMRKITVEPVIGNLKENLGLREFCLRGLEKVKIELSLASIVHNLKKIWKKKRESKLVIRDKEEVIQKILKKFLIPNYFI